MEYVIVCSNQRDLIRRRMQKCVRDCENDIEMYLDRCIEENAGRGGDHRSQHSGRAQREDLSTQMHVRGTRLAA